jgi:glycine cleavage system aminomethyltransferase T
MSSVEEHLATRRAAGLFDFSFMGLYELSNIESVQSRDLANLELGQIAYTLLLNDDGSVFNDASVWRVDADRYWLFTGRRSDIEWLGDAARDRSGEFAVLALQGPASGRALAKLIGEPPVRGLRYFRFLETRLGSIPTHVGRLGFSGELGYEILIPAAEMPAVRKAILGLGITECSFDAADSLRIESGYVLFDREIDGHANPRELGLDRLVSDRRRTFGMSRKLVGLEILGREARADLPVAHVTSECDSPTLGKRIALGFVAADAGPGDLLRLDDSRPARVARLPFYDPDKRRMRAAPL